MKTPSNRMSLVLCDLPVFNQEYMGPEFFEGQAYGAGVDVWALGVVLYEVLHRKLPFT